jgi:hypothetical protein
MRYYLPKPGTREYEPVEVLPPGASKRDSFLAVEPYTVHAKPYGVDTKKPIPVTVYGVNRDQLLFKYNGDVSKYGAYVTEWDTCYFNQTTEGYRFVRSVVKLVKVLTTVSKKVAVERRKVERNRAEAKAREGREGTCQICEGRQIIQPTGENKGTLVLHGYNRPGYGYAVGQCIGYHELPFEVSCKALENHIGSLKLTASYTAKRLEELPTRKTLLTRAPYPSKETVEIDASDPRFNQVRELKKYELEMELRQVTREIEYQEGRVAAWYAARA